MLNKCKVIHTGLTLNGVDLRRAGDVNPLIGTIETHQIRALTYPARKPNSLRSKGKKWRMMEFRGFDSLFLPTHLFAH